MKKREISAEIIADSISSLGDRLTTFVLVFPRIVLAELNTHRVFSRNSASSRAIPFTKMLESVEQDPFIPIKWMKDHSGMQGSEYFTDEEVRSEFIKANWLYARDKAVEQAKRLNESGLTKQIVNRLLEPFLWHTVIVTATNYENFFALRAHEAAEIHIQDLAYKMLEQYNRSIPIEMITGHWHIPFDKNLDEDRIIEDFELEINEDTMNQVEQLKLKIATARCARVSYLNFEGKDDYKVDVELYDRLSKMGHWSPFEHCAQVLHLGEYGGGNFRGWKQLRHTFYNENKNDERVIKHPLQLNRPY